MTLSSLFDLSFQGRRREPALDWQGTTLTFGELDARACRMGRTLAARGLAPGDRLAVFLPNSPAYVDLFVAVTRLAAIFVPVNILYRDREIGHILGDADPRAIITDDEHRAFVPAGAPVWLVEDLLREAATQGDQRDVRVVDGDTPAAIVYTSGTTGVAKGAVLSHNVFAVNAANIVTAWQITAADRLLLTLPLFHVHGLGNGIHAWLATGCRLFLKERFEHQQAQAWFEDARPTLFFGVPTMYVRLLDLPEAAARTIGERMRLFVSGSAPLAAQVFDDFRARFGHAILERYGMSETLMNISNPYAGERRPGTVGLPLPGVSVKLVEGEVHVRGAHLFSGYWRRPEATAAAFAEGGWFRTGDMAERSEDGYYTLRGRRTDLIISGGFNIYPREIEEFLAEQPGVTEAAVVGVADSVRGELPVAFYAGDAGPEELEAACRRHLASFKVPRSFQRVDKLPRTALGKVQKHYLLSNSDK